MTAQQDIHIVISKASKCEDVDELALDVSLCQDLSRNDGGCNIDSHHDKIIEDDKVPAHEFIVIGDNVVERDPLQKDDGVEFIHERKESDLSVKYLKSPVEELVASEPVACALEELESQGKGFDIIESNAFSFGKKLSIENGGNAESRRENCISKQVPIHCLNIEANVSNEEELGKGYKTKGQKGTVDAGSVPPIVNREVQVKEPIKLHDGAVAKSDLNLAIHRKKCLSGDTLSEMEVAELTSEISALGPPIDLGFELEPLVEVFKCPIMEVSAGEDSGACALGENETGPCACYVENDGSETTFSNGFIHDNVIPAELDVSLAIRENMSSPVDSTGSEILTNCAPIYTEGLPCDSHNSPIPSSEVGNDLLDSTESTPQLEDSNLSAEHKVGGTLMKSNKNSSCGNGDQQPEISSDEPLKVKCVSLLADSIECPPSCSSGNTGLEIDVENGCLESDDILLTHVNNAILEPAIGSGNVDHEKIPTSPIENETACVDDVAQNTDDLDFQFPLNRFLENENTSLTGSVVDVLIDDGCSTASMCGFPNGDINAIKCDPEILNIKNEGHQLVTGDSENIQKDKENKEAECVQQEETIISGNSDFDASNVQNVGKELVKERTFFYLVKIPRYEDENLRKEIQLAQLNLDELTRKREAIRTVIRSNKAARKEYNDAFRAAVSKENADRELLKSKNQERSSAQSVISTTRNAMSIDEVDGKIHLLEYKIQHEILPLKEEKKFVYEIQQLKQIRTRLPSSVCSKQDEVQHSLDKNSQTKERLKALKMDVDILKNNLSRAEQVTKAAKKKYTEEKKTLESTQAKFKEADNVRQEAYAHLQSLKKKQFDKNKYFRMYKDYERAVGDCIQKGDMEALRNLSAKQVETVMELWNKDDEFRKDYVRCNLRSTLRRLRTLDGRAMNPDEVPPVLPSYMKGRVDKFTSTPEINSLLVEEKINVIPEKVMAEVVEAEQKKMTALPRKAQMPASGGNSRSSATVSGRSWGDEVEEEEKKVKKEEEELARKTDELRKEEEANALREQRQLEEKAKAQVALERKKRRAEQAQARAELRAQKEAEEKAKEKEKRAKKKKKKKTAVGEVGNGCNEGDAIPTPKAPAETVEEPEAREKAISVSKRTQKVSKIAKQKPKLIRPPPLNRNKRKVKAWMWWLVLIFILVTALIMVGSGSLRYGFGLKHFGF